MRLTNQPAFNRVETHARRVVRLGGSKNKKESDSEHCSELTSEPPLRLRAVALWAPL